VKIGVIAIKRLVGILLILILCTLLSGCWNYRGLNKLSIVTGVAVDRKDDNNYQLTMETVDLTAASKESAGKSQIIQSEGKTMFEAIRNAKKRVTKKLYFSDMKVLVVSNQIAREEGIKSILDFFMRDAEPRETVIPIISQEKTAKEIFAASGVDAKIISEELQKMIDKDSETTASTRKIANYQVFNMLQGEKEMSLVMPAVHLVLNNEKKVVEVNGIAIFKADKLKGYLSPEDTHYYLFTVDEVKGGILTFPSNEKNQKWYDDLSFEIAKNKTKRSYSYDGNRLKFILDIKTTAVLDEVGADIDVIKKENIEKIKSTADRVFTDRLESVIKKEQIEFGCDIFGIGTMIHKSNPLLWSQLKENWEYYIQTMEVEVRPEFLIINTGLEK